MQGKGFSRAQKEKASRAGLKDCPGKPSSYKKSNMTGSISEMQAEVCKTFTNPKRLDILNILKNEEKTTSQLVAALGTTKSNISQHLTVMRLKGVLTTRREGINVYYRIANPKVIEVSALMKDMLFELNMTRKKAIAGV